MTQIVEILFVSFFCKREIYKEEKMTIYTFDTTNYLLYPIMKSYFKLNDKEVYKTVQSGFEILQKQLMLKKVSYTDLKGALIPSQDKDRYEICFVVDTYFSIVIKRAFFNTLFW